ncbi:putative gliotoxin biosynthesis protein [Rosellinia necatrix]|uniref:gamma-glutamylcyclotransferase n=1 Tax=Rosellinia necatrix TaxID=77044 RepID=A0A1S7UJH4_ROSNE|nr:putative gliotoxin biosynthesis protein [Rosellinia necatrix]
MGKQPDTKAEEGRTAAEGSAASEQGQSSLRRLSNSPTWTRAVAPPPSPKSYPPISSIPRTSPERLAQASADGGDDAGEKKEEEEKTILYLAYGSNLCAETFLGMRKIRPLSQINVSAPAFDLCFDLPGIPYMEPRFANTRPRKLPIPIPNPPKFPPLLPPSPSSLSSSLSPRSSSRRRTRSRRRNEDEDEDEGEDDGHDSSGSVGGGDDDGGDDDEGAPRPTTWTKGLYGVVYEVTPEDYANIIKTEGGGRGYHDVLTPCVELPPAVRVPEHPPIPDLPRPFLAHTLFAPPLPGLDDDDDDDGNSSRARRWAPTWLRRLARPVHRPGDAEASARYLKLIRDGAREHGLPADYRAYLGSFAAYAATTARQRAGRALFLLCAAPALVLVLSLSRLLADRRDGRVPAWLGLATNACMNLLWAAYDAVFRPLFGDGERTEHPPRPRRRPRARTTTTTTRSAGIRMMVPAAEKEAGGLMGSATEKDRLLG